MSEPFAEATVVITPKLGSFVRDLDGLLKTAMEKVKTPKVQVAPALTRDFVGDLRRQVNAAVEQAQRGIKPIRIKALIEPVGVATGTAGTITRGAAGAGGGAGGGGGGGGRGLANGNQALARSLEHVATAQINLNRAFDESIPLEQQIAAVTKVTTSLDDARAAAERTLAKAIVAKDTALQKSARKQLADIADFQAAVAPRAAAVQAQIPAVANDAAIAKTRRAADATKVVVAGLNAADAAAAKLGTTTAELAAQQDLLKQRTLILADATKAETKALATDNTVVQKAAINAKARAVAAVESSKQQIAAIKEVQRTEAAAAKQTEKLARAAEVARQRQARAAATAAASERRRSEQLSRGGQASLLSLAGIRGATLAASRSFLVGAAAITVFARAVKQFADLERNLDVFRATTSATAEQMEAVRKEATALGADLTLPAVSAGDAAGAMVELAKAGLTVQDSIDGARAVLELATAAAIDNADAVRLVANVLNAFSLSGREAIQVADTLANAANESQGSIADIGTAFQQAASAGKQVGLSFQDTATFLTILAKNGLRGSDAGTSLRTALIRLVNPSEKAKEAFNKLGITLRDAQGNIRPDVFLQIAEATAKLAPAQRDATIALIGGQDAFRAVTILGRQSIESFIAMRRALRQEGTAAELAAARTEGLHGAMDGLQSVLETVGTNLARHVGPGLADFVHEVSNSITALSQSSEVANVLNTALDSLTIQFGLLGNAIEATLAVALPFAKVAANLTSSIGAPALLGGFIAFRTLNALLDGAILRMRILKPLFVTIATARIGASLSTGFTAASLALERFNKQAGAVDGAPVKGFQRLTQVQKELAVATAASATRMSTFRVATRAVGPALVGLATSGTALTIAVAAAAAGLFFLITRESAAERASKKLANATRDLASAIGELNEARRDVGGTSRAVNQEQLGLLQARQALITARAARNASTAAPGSFAQRKAELGLAIALDDVAAATDRVIAAERERDVAREAALAAEQRRAVAFDAEIQGLQALIDANEQAARARIANAPGQSDGPAGVSGVKAQQALQDAIQKTAEQVKKTALEERRSADASVREVAKRKQAWADLVTFLQRPLSPTELDIVFNSDSVAEGLRTLQQRFREDGNRAGEILVASILAGMGLDKEIPEAVHDGLRGIGAIGEPEGKQLGDNIVKGVESAVSRLTAVISKATREATRAATRLIIAETEGASLQAQLVIARQQRRAAEDRFQAAKKLLGRGETPSRRAEFEDAAQARSQAQDEVERILEEIAAADKDAAQKVKDAQDKRDSAGEKFVQAVLKSRRATLLQRRITTASLSEQLNDDLIANKAWLVFLKKQKEAILKRLKDIGAAQSVIKDAMEKISDLIFETTNTIKKLNQDIQDAAEEGTDVLNSLVFQKIDIRISIAHTQENVAEELRLRRRRLELITRELVKTKNTVGKNTLAWLQLKQAQVEEIAAIKELEKTQQEKNRANAELFFTFLQTQAGFAANLLGNLLPMGAIGGTVGNTGGSVGGTSGGGGGTGGGPFQLPREQASGLTMPNPNFGVTSSAGGGTVISSPSAGLSEAQRVAEAGGRQGFTTSQAATLVALTRQMVNLLSHLNDTTKHPEAKKARAANNAALDARK